MKLVTKEPESTYAYKNHKRSKLYADHRSGASPGDDKEIPPKETAWNSIESDSTVFRDGARARVTEAA